MATRDGDGDAATTFTPATLRALVERSNGALCAFACDGVVFDATLGKDFYGVGGPYAALNGRDATRALATMKINVSDADEALGGDFAPTRVAHTIRDAIRTHATGVHLRRVDFDGIRNVSVTIIHRLGPRIDVQ